MAELPFTFSIVIPTFNAEPYLATQLGTLQSLIQHVVLLDSRSKDRTRQIAHEHGVKVVDVATESFDHGGTRSKASKICDSDIVLFLTQDALPVSAEDILKLLTIFQDEEVGAAYGRQLPYNDATVFGAHMRTFNYGHKSYVRSCSDKEEYGIKTAFLSNSFAAYRRNAMDRIDWFKNGLILGEDTYAGAKLLQEGYKLAYVAEAQVYHSHSYTVFEEFKRYFDIGVFHQMEAWILMFFGKPEGEGLRYIRSEFNYLMSHAAYGQIPEFFVRNMMKFTGYKIGKLYRYLPRNLIKKISMHSRWWDKYWSRSV